jgi:hypothetical protein
MSARDDIRMHRLQTLDRALYARLTGVRGWAAAGSVGDTADTVTSAQQALARVGAIRDIAVPPAIWAVLETHSNFAARVGGLAVAVAR